jgi:hypothetical protein
MGYEGGRPSVWGTCSTGSGAPYSGVPGGYPGGGELGGYDDICPNGAASDPGGYDGGDSSSVASDPGGDERGRSGWVASDSGSYGTPSLVMAPSLLRGMKGRSGRNRSGSLLYWYMLFLNSILTPVDGNAREWNGVVHTHSSRQ